MESLQCSRPCAGKLTDNKRGSNPCLWGLASLVGDKILANDYTANPTFTEAATPRRDRGAVGIRQPGLFWR